MARITNGKLHPGCLGPLLHLEQQWAIADVSIFLLLLMSCTRTDTATSAPPLNLANSPSLHLLTPGEQILCSQLRIFPKPYLVMKETLVREYARRGGKLRRREARDLVKVDVNKTSRVWDFLMRTGFLKVNSEPALQAATQDSSGSVSFLFARFLYAHMGRYDRGGGGPSTASATTNGSPVKDVTTTPLSLQSSPRPAAPAPPSFPQGNGVVGQNGVIPSWPAPA